MFNGQHQRMWMVGTGLTLGLGSGLALWGILVEQEQLASVLPTSLGVSVGMLVGFPAWAQIGKRLHAFARTRFWRWLIVGIGLGVVFGGATWLLTAILTGRLGEGGPLSGLRVPFVLGLWNAVLVGVGYGSFASSQRDSS